MSTINTTITNNVYYGSGEPYASPLTITNTGEVTVSSAAFAAAVEGSGGGTLINDGAIIGSGTGVDGVLVTGAGGSIINAGSIQGFRFGVDMEQAGYVMNSGTIRATGANTDAFMASHGGGTLTNIGTIISSLSGNSQGVVIDGAGETVNNSKLIEGYSNGLYLLDSAVVTNFSTGTILSTGNEAEGALVALHGVTLTNQGTILATAQLVDGVAITGAATVNNSGLIQGNYFGFQMAGTGVVINSGIIRSNAVDFIGGSSDFSMYGGSLTNTASGYINNGVNVNVFSDGNGYNGTVVNEGTIVNTSGIGIQMNSELGPDGAEHLGTGTIFEAGTVSGAGIGIYFGGTNALLVLENGYKIKGIVEAAGNYNHTVQLLGSAAAPVTVNFNPTSFSNFGTVGFAPGSTNDGTLALAGSADIPGTISGFTALHDVVDLGFISDTLGDATAILNPLNDQLTVIGDNGSSVLQLANNEVYPLFQTTPDASGTGTDVEIICFCRGTRILTGNGEVPVEALNTGDRVRLFGGGIAPIVWIGQGQVLATRGRRSAATPVIVRRGALADNVPSRDLHVTKAHSLYIDDVLIPVEFLVNHRSIVWDDRAREVSLYHIELATHGVLIANGAPAESYRDDGNRWLFHNANSGWALPPQAPCAPVLTGGPLVDAVWRRLLERSGPRRELPLTDHHDLHLLVDGERLNAARRTGCDYVFSLPRVPNAVRIVSRAAAPQELGLARDPRSLGVAVRRVCVRRGRRLRIIEADDALLREGFHSFEADNGFRWTSGDAVLPYEAFAGFTGALEIVLTVVSTMNYLDEGDRLPAEMDRLQVA